MKTEVSGLCAGIVTFSVLLNHVAVTGYQVASLGFSHCEIQGFYRAGKFNYFLSNNATVESRMLHQRLT